MICTSIQNKTLSEIFTILDSGSVEMAEIRIDLCPQLNDTDLDNLFSRHDVCLIATCRIGGDITDSIAEHKLTRAIEAGVAFVDLEIEAPIPMGERIRSKAIEYGVQYIRSVHYYDGTPQLNVLKDIAHECVMQGADVVKIVTFAHSEDDAERVMRLYEGFHNGRLTAFCMGEAGKETRMGAIQRGAPFTYAALNAEECTAVGQWTTLEMTNAIYGANLLWRGGIKHVPASKSMAQRAIIAATLANGTSVLRNYSSCADSESAIKLSISLGTDIKRDENTLIIKGIGTSPKIQSEIFTGESGFLTRVTIPIISMLYGGSTMVKGTGTLVGRKLLMVKEIMEQFGVILKNANEEQNDVISVPFHINGRLHAANATVHSKGGSQLISGLMFALPLSEKDSEITIDEPRSVPYLYVTKDVLHSFGIDVSVKEKGDKLIIKTTGGSQYKPADITIEGDWSGAAPLLIAGAVYGSVTIPELNINSIQADKSIIDILELAGANITFHNGCVSVAKSPLHSFCADLNQAPDLFPSVSVLAALCEGESRLKGVGRLASKESDRASAIIDMFNGLGVCCKIEDDTLVISGMSLSHRYATGKRLKGGKFTSHHDHRMVMALMVAQLCADNEITIDDVECVAKSFPGFQLADSEIEEILKTNIKKL